MKEKKLLYGVGINNANYPIRMRETLGYNGNGKQIQKTLWMCPFYIKWYSMIQRCYSSAMQKTRPNYVGCSVTPEWHYFMTFRSWMIEQDWNDKCLDKDLLFPTNTIYGPYTCIFVDAKVNTFLGDGGASLRNLPMGASFNKEKNSYEARCRNPLTGKRKHLGYHATAEQAHQAWLDKKIEMAYALASQQSDPRVAAALIDRYENYEKYFGGIK